MSGLLPSEEVPILPREDFRGFNFDLSPDNSQGKIVFTIHGHKGAGKTYGALAITTGRIGGFQSGKTVAISFDNKTKITKDQWFPQDNIIVHDGKKYYSKDPELRTKSGYMSYIYLQKLLENEKKEQPDWVLIDGFSDLAEILEMSMRYINGLKPTQGFANRNIWKDRGAMIQKIHDCAISTARVGVIYTTYSDKEEIIQDGEIVTKSDVPKYVDVVMRETDVVLKTTKARGKDNDLFYISVESTKYKQYLDTNGKMLPIINGVTLQQGRTFNITGLAENNNKSMGQNVSKEPSIKPSGVEKPLAPTSQSSGGTILKDTTLPTQIPSHDTSKIEQREKPKFEIPDLLNI